MKDSFSTPIHIGYAIQARAEEVGMSPEELAREVEVQPERLRRLFARRSMGTELLHRFSVVLSFNFFALYSYDFNAEKRLRLQQLAREIVQLTQ